MQISDKDMIALSLIEVNKLDLTRAQKDALERIIQSIRTFLSSVGAPANAKSKVKLKSVQKNYITDNGKSPT